VAFHGGSTNGGGSTTGVYGCRSLTEGCDGQSTRAHAKVRRHGQDHRLDEVVLQRRDLARAWLNADAAAQLPESTVAGCGLQSTDVGHDGWCAQWRGYAVIAVMHGSNQRSLW
jgi:hypothetical protein